MHTQFLQHGELNELVIKMTLDLNLNNCPNCGTKLEVVRCHDNNIRKYCDQCDLAFDEINYCDEPFTVSHWRDDHRQWTLSSSRMD